MRLPRSLALLAAVLASASAGAQQPPAQVTTQALGEPVIQTESLDAAFADGMAARREALARLAPRLQVERQAIAPDQCAAAVDRALAAGAYQVFIERQGQVPALVPMAFSVGLRDRADAGRLPPVCKVATGLVVARFPEAVTRATDARTRRDYAIALTMADWVQSKADGLGLLGLELPPDVTPDPFGVLQRPQAAPRAP